MGQIIKSKIIEENGVFKYFDKEGNELHDGDMVHFEAGATVDGKPMDLKLYETEDGELGTDATNPSWIERGMAVACQYGIYPLNEKNLLYATLIKN